MEESIGHWGFYQGMHLLNYFLKYKPPRNGIFSRFDFLNQLIGGNLMLSTYGCCIFSLTFTCMAVHVACMCIVRIACLTHLLFLEESIGESNVRVIAWVVTGMVGVGVMVTLAITGDVRTGTIFVLLTNQVVPVSK